MAETIECLHCDAKDCRGCNVFTLSQMLLEGKFDALMDKHYSINPTIEAEPVKHGRWENWSPPYLGMEYSYDTKKCSECGHTMANALLIPAHYCPNCGAKMDGGET